MLDKFKTKNTFFHRNDYVSRILILGEIDSYSANDIIAAIYEINEFDKNISSAKREYIQLIINSEGGDVYSGFGIIDAIEISQTPIHTICHGQAMSMALPIFCAGKYRTVSNNSTLMYHQLSWGNDGTVSLKNHKDEIEESERIQKQIDKYIISKTGITNRKLTFIKNKSKDWYITPEESVKLKIANKVL